MNLQSSFTHGSFGLGLVRWITDDNANQTRLAQNKAFLGYIYHRLLAIFRVRQYDFPHMKRSRRSNPSRFVITTYTTRKLNEFSMNSHSCSSKHPCRWMDANSCWYEQLKDVTETHQHTENSAFEWPSCPIKLSSYFLPYFTSIPFYLMRKSKKYVLKMEKR